jgi:20S proteasome subunit alpha 3
MYDSRTTIFSPEGHLYQVHYAMEAINQAQSAIGIRSEEGIVLAAAKGSDSKLLDIRSSTEKMYKIDDHIAVAVAGITADANTLLNFARLEAQRYFYQYQEPIPIEQLLMRVADLKQLYTQSGGLRPFGVSFLFAGWDEHHGFQLFQSDPSGNYGGWRASAIGANHQAADSILKDEYKQDFTLRQALIMAIKVLSTTMDTTEPAVDKVELSTVSHVNGEVVYHVLTTEEVQSLLTEAEPWLKQQEAEQEN